MIFDPPLVKAELLKREKRFLSYCRLADGSEVVAHCPNSGSMKGNQDPSSPVWLKDFGPGHAEEGRKLRYKWVMVESRGVKVVIDTNCANSLVAEGLRQGKVAGLPGEFKQEHKTGASRLDFHFPPDVFMEVKSVSMGEGAMSSFPDAVTERGQKHILELLRLKEEGKRAILFFLITREGSLQMSPAESIDPEYARLLRLGVEKGLEVLVYGIKVRPDGFELGEKGRLIL